MVADARCPRCGGVKRPNRTTVGLPSCGCIPTPNAPWPSQPDQSIKIGGGGFASVVGMLAIAIAALYIFAAVFALTHTGVFSCMLK